MAQYKVIEHLTTHRVIFVDANSEREAYDKAVNQPDDNDEILRNLALEHWDIVKVKDSPKTAAPSIEE